MVTLIGGLCQLSGVLIIICFDLSISKPLPNWVYFYFVFAIFMGQTLDAIDGKHARNTNRCSPLGQLIDHGVDVFCCSNWIIMICQSHLMGATLELILLLCVIQV